MRASAFTVITSRSLVLVELSVDVCWWQLIPQPRVGGGHHCHPRLRTGERAVPRPVSLPVDLSQAVDEDAEAQHAWHLSPLQSWPGSGAWGTDSIP